MKQRSTVLTLAASILSLSWALGHFSHGLTQAGASQPDVKDIYLDKCAVCHGKDGAGKTAKGKKVKVKDIRETVNKMSEEEMIKVIEKGKGANMDAYGKEFSKDQIKALVDYYRGLAKR